MKLIRCHTMVLLILLVLTLSFRESWPQQHILVRMNPDGSLIILDKAGCDSKALTKPKNEIDLVGSQLKVKIIRGSTENSDEPPVITRGRGNRQGQFGLPAAPPAPLSPAPASPLPVPDTPISSLIDKSAREHGLDPGLVRLVVQKESGFNPQAVSPKGAMGLMQLMPGTASLLGVHDPFNPAQNIDGGVRYLKQCLERFNYNVSLALAAYNAGPENVAKYQGVPPFAETRNYVANIMQEYTGQPPDLPMAPPALLPAQSQRSNQPVAKRVAFSQADLQPLFLPGGGRVQVIQSGRSKIIEIVAQ